MPTPRPVLACIAVALAGTLLLSGATTSPRRFTTEPPTVVTNDNRTPAGVLRDGVLTIRMVAAPGLWFPEAGEGRGHEVYVFGEEGGELRNPGPLLRVPVGTEIRATLRNAVGDAPLIVHGLHDRPGPADTIHVPAGGSREVQFRASAAGTYFYWATTRDLPRLADRYGMDSQLIGALIVDPPGAPGDEHVFVLGFEDGPGMPPSERPIHAAAVNGLSWPHSATMTVHEGDTVRMRWINVTDRTHPMHLHGFYFRVDSRGTIAADSIYEPEQRRLAVTELLPPGTSMSITWVPDRPGNWVMHCHMASHMSREARSRPHEGSGEPHVENHALEAMSGLVTGWRVLPRDGAIEASPPAREPRSLRLLVQSAPRRYGDDPAFGFVLQTSDVMPPADSVVIPGPTLVLERGVPVRIVVVNRLAEPTSIHWHGIELDSYYDGVSGWSGEGAHIAPHIEPGDSFEVRFTPPRAGTFIYHSHFEEKRQLGSGMYGAIVVLEPGATYDPDTDRTWILGRGGPLRTHPVLLNGTTSPLIDLEAGRTYRIRLINIQPDLPVTFALLADSVPVVWRAVAKDGADLPVHQAQPRQAALAIGVGEAYDFEITPDAPRDLQVRVTNPAGAVQLLGTVRIGPAGRRGGGEDREPS
jgi:FtsP/CotA-like multicopper oxidase with cupredoxin domain